MARFSFVLFAVVSVLLSGCGHMHWGPRYEGKGMNAVVQPVPFNERTSYVDHGQATEQATKHLEACLKVWSHCKVTAHVNYGPKTSVPTEGTVQGWFKLHLTQEMEPHLDRVTVVVNPIINYKAKRGEYLVWYRVEGMGTYHVVPPQPVPTPGTPTVMQPAATQAPVVVTPEPAPPVKENRVKRKLEKQLIDALDDCRKYEKRYGKAGRDYKHVCEDVPARIRSELSRLEE